MPSPTTKTDVKRPPGRPRAQGGDQLSPELILEAGLRLAARRGADLTVRRLGEELGADPTAIYRHFRDKDDLMLALADRVLGEVVDAVPEGLGWQDRLRALAEQAMRVVEHYPAVGVIMAPRTVRRRHEFRAVELILGAMHDAGLEGDEAVLHYRTFGDMLLSYSGMRAGAALLAPAVRERDESSWAREYRAVDPSEFPHITALADELTAVTDDDVLTRLVETMIRAAETAATSTKG